MAPRHAPLRRVSLPTTRQPPPSMMTSSPAAWCRSGASFALVVGARWLAAGIIMKPSEWMHLWVGGGQAAPIRTIYQQRLAQLQHCSMAGHLDACLVEWAGRPHDKAAGMLLYLPS